MPAAAKKGKNPAMVIAALGAVVVLLVIVAVVVVVLSQNSAPKGKVLATHDTTQMGKAEGKAYTFYYPKGFAKATALEADEEGLVQNYSSPNLNANGGANSVNLVYTKQDPDIKGQSDCTLGGQQLASTYATQLGLAKDAIKSKTSEYFTKGSLSGCDFAFEVTYSGQTLNIEQLMFVKSGMTGTYAVTLTSDKTDSAEYTALRNAAESFMIK